MSKNSVVVVESPAKAKTINKYLGSGYTVLASFGHVRDLPPKDGSVEPDNDFNMHWELSERAGRPLSDIAKALKGAGTLYLASDPDREGEAIAWHVKDVLRDKGALKNVDVKRITFNEITKAAIKDAIANPRELDQPLIDAYLARRALDYLVGFSLSPVLWRKLPGSRSAGRVQSVALRLICERESEIEAFKAEEYWTIGANFQTSTGQVFPARLTQWRGKKLEKFDINNEAAATAVVNGLQGATFNVGSVERKQVRRNPYAPFTTSTLQQEGSRKLYLGATRIMRIAQQLYEGVDIGGETVGLITYMRTDGVTIGADAINAIRNQIGKDFGNDYLPPAARVYQTKTKNAQEAHEAIRPTDIARRPQDVAKYLDDEQKKLYTLIWQRTMASQMAAAVMDQVSVDIIANKEAAMFRATGSVVQFPGFLSVYQDAKEEEDNEENRRLPNVQQNETVDMADITPDQHFTEPPPRYSEASLVKTLEELGIGRPSTYASIMQVLQDRNYVKLDKRRFTPEDRGRLVTTFLMTYFKKYVEYDFTAKLEEELDEIAEAKTKYKKVLKEFWAGFHKAIDGTKDLRVSEVLDVLDAELGPHFFPDGNRTCPACKTGRLGLKLGKFGAFIGCSNYPECKHTQQLAVATDENGQAPIASDGPKELGVDEKTGLMITLRRGPYGPYVQLGEAPEKPKEKPKRKKGEKAEKIPGPKRVSLPRGINAADLDLAMAQKLLTLPRDIGLHPDNADMITAGIGRFGPYLKWGATYKSIPAGDDVLTIGLNRAVDLLSTAKPKTPAVEVGKHPQNKKPILMATGRFGPYLKWGKIMATVPKEDRDGTLSLERAVEILAAKAEKGGSGKGKATKSKKSANDDMNTESN
ncbi:MAG: type I DNA topoisomerase, partial [Bdellovibrionales bacterium]